MRSATIPGSQRSCCCSGPAATSAPAGGGVRGAGLALRPRARRPRDVTAHARRAPRAAAAGQAGGAGEAPGLARTRGGPSAPRWAGRGCCARNSPACPAVFHAGACALHTGRVCIPTAQPRCAAAPRSSPRRSPELPAAWAHRDPLPHACVHIGCVHTRVQGPADTCGAVGGCGERRGAAAGGRGETFLTALVILSGSKSVPGMFLIPGSIPAPAAPGPPLPAASSAPHTSTAGPTAAPRPGEGAQPFRSPLHPRGHPEGTHGCPRLGGCPTAG